MKQILRVLFLTAIITGLVTGCQQASSGNNDDNNNEAEKAAAAEKAILEKKLSIYTSLLGTYEKIENGGGNFVDNLILAMDSITLDSNRYSFNPNTDIVSWKDIPKNLYIGQDGFDDDELIDFIFLKINSDYYELDFNDNASTYDIVLRRDTFADRSIMKKVSSGSGAGGSGDGEGDVTIDGSYTPGNAHMLGNVVFADDGTWSLTAGSATGTWEQNENILSVTVSKSGYTFTCDFTISVSGDVITLTGGDYAATIIAELGIQDSNAISTGVITITAN